MNDQTKIYPPLTEAEFNRGSYDDSWPIPVNSNEDGDHYTYGHVDKAEFAAAVNRLNQELSGEEEPVTAEDIHHVRAVTVDPGEEWWINWSPEYQDHPLSFHITMYRW